MEFAAAQKSVNSTNLQYSPPRLPASSFHYLVPKKRPCNRVPRPITDHPCGSCVVLLWAKHERAEGGGRGDVGDSGRVSR